MFTGIIETVGKIAETRPAPSGKCLRVKVGDWAEQVTLGASICISGACLTVTETKGDTLAFDVVQETLDKTTLGRKRVGDAVNIERSLCVGDPLDGHFVQGHVDGIASVKKLHTSSREWVVWFEPQRQLVPAIIPKGSIAIDGVSLTIAALAQGRFSVALIPTTLDGTTLDALSVGDSVNIETDMIARTIVHRLDAMSRGGEVTLDTLREAGFA